MRTYYGGSTIILWWTTGMLWQYNIRGNSSVGFLELDTENCNRFFVSWRKFETRNGGFVQRFRHARIVIRSNIKYYTVDLVEIVATSCKRFYSCLNRLLHSSLFKYALWFRIYKDVTLSSASHTDKIIEVLLYDDSWYSRSPLGSLWSCKECKAIRVGDGECKVF